MATTAATKPKIPVFVGALVNFFTQLLLVILCFSDEGVYYYHYSSYHSGVTSYYTSFMNALTNSDGGILVLVFFAQFMFFLLLWSFLCATRAVKIPCYKFFTTMYCWQFTFLLFGLIAVSSASGYSNEGPTVLAAMLAFSQIVFSIVNRTQQIEIKPAATPRAPYRPTPAYQPPRPQAYQPAAARRCPTCGGVVHDSRFCPYCGTNLTATRDVVSTSAICPGCGAKTNGMRFCAMCGVDLLGGSAPSPLASTTPPAKGAKDEPAPTDISDLPEVICPKCGESVSAGFSHCPLCDAYLGE